MFWFIFQCSPVDKFWNFRDQGVCIDIWWLVLGSSISHLIVDIAILILPVPTVQKLQISWAQKAMLSVVFAQGGL